MLTALTVKKHERRKGIKGLADRLRRDRAVVKIKRARGVYLKHITYISYGRKPRFEKLEKIVGDSKNRIICSPKIKFESDSKFKRFENSDFSARLCTNLAICLLSMCDFTEKLKIGIYDLDGRESEFLPYVMKYSSDVTVVTDCPDVYYDENELVMENMGACSVVTKRTEELEHCHLIIAPHTIEKTFSSNENTLILTNGRPKAELTGEVYYKYYFKMPNGFDRIKPQEIETEYFCSALYSLGRQYSLGSIVPTMCSNFSATQTVKSLYAMFEKLYKNSAKSADEN